MQLWFSLYFLIIGLVCLVIGESSSKSRCKLNVYAKKSEVSPENEVSPNDTDTSDSGSGDEFDEDCNIHDMMKSWHSGSNSEGFTDCQPTQPINCDSNSPYRTMNASCNNLRHPLWGAANQCYRRIIKAFYTGYADERKSVTGAPLPNPRNLSVNIFQNRHHPTEDVSFMFTIYGQTVAHDISLAEVETPDNQDSCCAAENVNDAACMSVAVSPNDPFYSQFGVTCLNFFRTIPCNACNTDTRQQNTAQTTPMDLSIVYGPNDDLASRLRTNDGTGRLNSNYTKKGEFLPSGNNPRDPFCPMLKRWPCFNAGDARVNQHSALTSMHTIFMREHNRIAEELLELNPRWNDERLYQEARRINIAQVQYITFQEYLPHLLGQYYMSQFNLYVQRGTGSTRYNSNLRLGAWNEFSSVAFRIHSMVATDVGALNLEFRNLFSNPKLIWQGHAGDILNGVCKVPSEEFDRWFVYDVTDYMAQQPGVPYGQDLTVLDIQRGRDHGTAPYVYYIQYCSDGEVNIQSFDDLAYYDIISKKDVQTLKQNYMNVQDIDLYVGLQMEYHSRGAKVGPTAACILARQFYHLKYADRFYFEHMGEAGSFTRAQLASIKHASLSRLLCDNTYISQVQLNAMLLQSSDNPKMWCKDIPQVDLSPWRNS